MTRPKEYEYNSFVEYARQLEAYCDELEKDADVRKYLAESAGRTAPEMEHQIAAMKGQQ